MPSIAISRDARKLLPRSLSRLLGEREAQVLDELRRFPPDLSQALAEDLPSGRLRPETVAALEAQADRVIELLKEGQVSQGVVRLGGLLRIPADLSDPVLAVGPEGWPPGVTREYYALFDANLQRMPVVLDDPEALKISRKDLPALWQSLVERSRAQAPVIRDGALPRRASRGPPPARLPLARVGRLLARLLARGHRHRRDLARRVARLARRHDPACRAPARCVPQDPGSALADDRRPPAPEAP